MRIGVFESDSSTESEFEMLSVYAESTSENTDEFKLGEGSYISNDTDEQESYCSESEYSDEHSSIKSWYEGSLTEIEDQSVQEIIPEEEISEEEEEEELNSKDTKTEKEGVQERDNTNEPYYPSVCDPSVRSESIVNHLGSVEELVNRSQSDSGRLSTSTSETLFKTVCSPEEESSNILHDTPHDLSSLDYLDTSDELFKSSDGVIDQGIINEKSLIEESVAIKRNSASEETSSSASFQTATSFNTPSSMVMEHSAIKKLETCDDESCSEIDSIQSLRGSQCIFDEVSSESNISHLSGRIFNFDVPDVHCDNLTSSETQNADERYGEFLRMESWELRSQCSHESNAKMKLSKLQNKNKPMSENYQKQSMNSGDSDSPVKNSTGESEEERKPHFYERTIKNEIVSPGSKLRCKDKSKRRYKRRMVAPPPTPEEKPFEWPLNANTVNDSILTTSPSEADSETLKYSQKRFKKYAGGAHVKEINHKENKQRNIDRTQGSSDSFTETNSVSFIYF